MPEKDKNYLKMKQLLLKICILVIPGIGLYSQELPVKPSDNWTKSIHLESGFIYPSGTIKESIAIRQNISSYFVNQSSTGQISSENSGFILGLRWEYFNKQYKSGISTGLRYTGYSSQISGFSASNADFFYLRYSMLNSDTKFARVKNIKETNNLIGIPLEFRIVPVQNKYFELFARGGTELSMFNLKKGTHIQFQDSNMDGSEGVILNNIGLSTNKFYSILYASLGLIIGNENKAKYLFEVFLPSLFLTKNNFTLADVDHFEGFKFSVQFPLH